MDIALSTSNRPTKASRERAIDLVHLSRMTFGDRALEREVLALFARQSVQIVQKMENAETDALRTLAHTLKGSASGVGAWTVADAAGAVEEAAIKKTPIAPSLARVQVAVDEACALADNLLRSH